MCDRVTRTFGLLVSLLLVGGAGAAGSPTPIVFEEHFPGPDGSAWPAPWQQLGGVDPLDPPTIVGGFGRLTPLVDNPTYPLARMEVPTVSAALNIEATFQFSLEDVDNQGVGFYVRQNGGYLQQTPLHGAGYCIFVAPPALVPPYGDIGLWTEVDGTEGELLSSPFQASLLPNTIYSVRFRVTQESQGSTHLQARFWTGPTEPQGWALETSDTTPSLQDAIGGFAFDSYNGNPAPPASGHFGVGTRVGNLVVAGW